MPNFIWDEKKKNIDVSFEWSLLDKDKQYSPGSGNCILCLTEKYHTLFAKLKVLNKLNNYQNVDRKTNSIFQITTSY